MEQVHAACDKLFEEAHWLERLLDVEDEDIDDSRIALALSVAKRVRSKTTLVIKALAREREDR